jgi:hypothetical protein
MGPATAVPEIVVDERLETVGVEPPPQAASVKSPSGVRLVCLYLKVLLVKDHRIKRQPRNYSIRYQHED